jgi:hypothetical protein
MTHDQLITVIGTLLGGLGIGSLITTVVTNWLEARGDLKRWRRDKKCECYVEIVKNLTPSGSCLARSPAAARARRVVPECLRVPECPLCRLRSQDPTLRRNYKDAFELD